MKLFLASLALAALLFYAPFSYAEKTEMREVPLTTLEKWQTELKTARGLLEKSELELVESERLLTQARERLALASIESAKLKAISEALEKSLMELSTKSEALYQEVRSLENEKEGWKWAAIIGIAAAFIGGLLL